MKEKLCLMVESEEDVETNNECLSNFSIYYQHHPIMIWYSRSKNKDNAEVIAKPSQELLEISKNRFALGFENQCLYLVKHVELSLHENVLIGVTFASKNIDSKDQILLCDFDPYLKNRIRGFGVNKTHIIIFGVECESM